MALALLIARLLLAGIFGVAGLTKLLDRTGTRDTLRNFHVPARLVSSLSVALPLLELLIAASLLSYPLAWWGAVSAASLLLLFVAVISFNLAQGRKPKCRCFGQLHSAPVGVPTLARNFLLAAIAAFNISQGRDAPSFTEWTRGISFSHRIEILLLTIFAALLVVVAWGLLLVLRQQGRLLRRLELLEAQFARGINSAVRTVGLTVGTTAPAFALPNLKGKIVTLETLCARGLPVILVFWDPDCYPCEALLPELGRWQRNHADKMTVVPISRGSVESNIGKVKKNRLNDVLLQQDHEVDDAYAVDATPTAVLVRADGTIGSPQAGGADKIYSLVVGILGLLGPSPLLTAASAAGKGQPSAGLAA